MKRRLNLICAFIFLTLIISFTHGIIDIIETTKEGTEASAKADTQTEYIGIKIQPTELLTFPDSVYNVKTNTWLPAATSEISVVVPKENPKKSIFINGLVSILYVIIGIIAIISFIKLIININKSIIFEWNSVKRLKMLGYCLIGLFAVEAVFKYVNFTSFNNEVLIRGYEVEWSSVFEFTYIILGLASLLFAEIFAIGLRLKEEQELTI